MRTREQHLHYLDTLEADVNSTADISTELGINYRSAFFELHHFHVDVLLPDVMHDILEGTLQYEAKLILQHAITMKYISYSMFESTLAGLELGYMEADNKPCQISSATLLSSEKTLGQKGTCSKYIQGTCMFKEVSRC